MTLPEAIKAKKAWNWFNYEFALDDTTETDILDDVKRVGDALDGIILSLGGTLKDGEGLI